jgi:hypothetical protein
VKKHVRSKESSVDEARHLETASLPDDLFLKASLVPPRSKDYFAVISSGIALLSLIGWITGSSLALVALVPMIVVWCSMFFEPKEITLDNNGITLNFSVSEPKVIPWNEFVGINPTYMNLGYASKALTINYRGGCFYCLPESKDLQDVVDFLVRYAKSK